MDLDVDTAAPPAGPAPQRWFGGLRRRRPRLLGGVAAGLADFWTVDPLLVRVGLVSPFVAGLLAMMALPWFDAYLDGLAVLGTQLVWLAAGAAATAYLVSWVLIPFEDRESLAQRFLALDGVLGALVKLVVSVTCLLLLGWAWLAFGLSLANWGVDPFALVFGGVLAVAGLGLAALWVARESDLRTLAVRLGTPGLGRFDDSSAPAPAQVVHPADDVLSGALPDPGPVADTRSMPEPPARESPATEAVVGSVDRARAAAEAAANAQAAAADAARRARVEQRRARRAAARAERRRRNRWGWLVAAVTLIAAGLLALTDRMGVTDQGLLGVGVISLALLTTGILVGSFFGSARWLILPALLLSGVLGAGSALTTALDQAATAPPVHLAPETTSTNDSRRWDFATVTVDLTETARLPGHAMDLGVDRGSLTVIVPADQWTSVSSQVVVGTNNVADGTGGGVRLGDVSLSDSGYDEWGIPSADPDYADQLYLNLHVGIGELTVIRQES